MKFISYIGGGGKIKSVNSARWFEVQTYRGSWKKPDSKTKSSLRFWMEVNRAISSVKLNKIYSTEGLTFNLCISLHHFTVLGNIEIETSHSRNVYIMKLVLRTEIAMVVSCNINFF